MPGSEAVIIHVLPSRDSCMSSKHQQGKGVLGTCGALKDDEQAPKTAETIADVCILTNNAFSQTKDDERAWQMQIGGIRN